jgi:hypothetical protein
VDSIKLLWTGGWDSTFRLLEIVLKEKKEVQPYYIVFKDRWSSGNELKTMQQMKKIIHRDYSSLAHLIKDTIIVDEEDIVEDEYIVSLYREFKSQINFGSQYKTIVCFAKQYEMSKLELGICKNGKIYRQIVPYLGELDSNSMYQIDKRTSPEKIYSFYKYFNFPLFKYSKAELSEMSEQMGWNELLERIWICHKPILGIIPCGGCNPCIEAANDAIKKHKVPLVSRVIGPRLKKIYNSKYFYSNFRKNKIYK